MQGRRLLSGGSRSWADKALRIRSGGRSSVSGVVATVFGSSGFLGRYVVNRLGGTGVQCIVPFRRDGDEVRHLRLMGDLGMINPIPFDIRDEESVFEAVKHSNVVVNLLGREWATRNYSLDEANNVSAERIARLSKEAGVKRFIHVSSLGAGNPNTKSEFNISKKHSEESVRAHFPDATIVRPARMFGEEDRIVNHTLNIPHWFGFLPISNRGDSKFRPVYVDDVAEAIQACLAEPETTGKIVELAGPETFDWFSFSELVLESGKKSGTSIVSFYPIPQLMGRLLGSFPWPEKMLTSDDIIRMGEDELPSDDKLGFEFLRIKPVTLTRELPYLTYKHRNIIAESIEH